MTSTTEIITIATAAGPLEVVAYAPAECRAFVVHSHNGRANRWTVTHRASGLRIPRVLLQSKEEALDVCAEIEIACPAGVDHKDDQPLPSSEFKEQFLAWLGNRSFVGVQEE